MKSQLSKGKRIKTSTKRKPLPLPPRTLQPSQDIKDTLATTKATQDQGTMPIETGSTVSTANCRITHRMKVSRGFERRNRAEIDKEEPTGLECT
jgi:hypothetical protein